MKRREKLNNSLAAAAAARLVRRVVRAVGGGGDVDARLHPQRRALHHARQAAAQEDEAGELAWLDGVFASWTNRNFFHDRPFPHLLYFTNIKKYIIPFSWGSIEEIWSIELV